MTPRFIPWDLPGRCTRCKSSTVEIDYVIQPQGVSIFSPRLKGGERFIGFDKSGPFGNTAYMRIKARNKVMNLPLKRPELAAIPETSNDYDWMSFNKHQVEPPNQTIPEAAKMEPGEIPPDN